MSYTNLFVAKLPRNLNDSDLEQIFAEYRPVSAKVMLDASTGRSKGFGFVLFRTEEEGKRAYDDLNRKSTRACRHNFNLIIYPSQHSGRAAVSPSNALYIRNIPITVPQAQVERFLSTFGTLAFCAMREDHYGNPVWVVYAEYDCLGCSKNALQRLHGSSEHFYGPPVMVKYADTDEAKQERRRRREEGKVPRAPPPRSVCVFPPTRQTAAPEVHQCNCMDVATAFSNNGNITVAACPREVTPSRDSTSCSLGPNLSSDTSSTASSAHKVLDNVFTPPPPTLLGLAAPPPMFSVPPQSQPLPMDTLDASCKVGPPGPPPVRRANSNKDDPPVMIVLENGQQLMLASNAVNLRPSDFALAAQSSLLWPPEVGYASPLPPPKPQPFTVVPFS
ncbi:putative RNA-binding protein [Trypanosoma cruzi]|uniref:RNA-binding protein n=1 Tax=Trypanosoma cruzi TaxID=5693 RepID=A0A7J6YIK6_TRYCR|nr:RNA-binding protein [Trypanosoma cruzi]KAF8294921.1 putative RNA-binding protein [Trypanosoma cruzi]